MFKNTRMRIVITTTLFILSLFAYLLVKPKKITDTQTEDDDKEGFTNNANIPKNCPSLLIKKDNKLYLKNTRKAEIPGVNPIVFNNLSEYSEFTEWMRSQGIKCPILMLQYENNAQGENGYRLMREINDTTNNKIPILDDIYGRQPRRQLLSDSGYTSNNFPGFDPQNQYQGVETPLDRLHRVQQEYTISDNPMDPNWGGPKFTEKNIKRGKYTSNDKRKTATELALEASRS